MKPYSIDLREKVINAYNSGNISVRKLAVNFGVGKAFVQKMLKQYKEDGHAHILHQYIKTSNSLDLRVHTRGTPTQLICRGAHCGYPGSKLSNSIFKLMQDVSMLILGSKVQIKKQY